MIRALLERFRGRRWTFVVGKGGVGKTTAAGAFALACADAGEATHLISVDPAHSLADLFGVPPLASPRASPCGERLVLEELDADAFGAAWYRENAPALGELIERGTYLDADDVAGFLRLSLPGVDEIMAALRLVELDTSAAARIVVDTAPTGHTLRLLEAGTTLTGWSSAFDAMRVKADAVAGALTGMEASAAGAAALARLSAQVERFESRVLGSAAFLVISRAEPVPVEETLPIRSELARRELGPVVELRVGGERVEREVVSAPWRPGVAGCEALRAYARGETSSPTRGRAAERADAGGVAQRSTDNGFRPRVRDVLEAPRLLFFAGKGGVGKSTCAAAAALGTAGEPVRLFGTDPAGSLAAVLEVEVGSRGAVVAPGVRAEGVDAAAALDEFRRRYLEEVDEMLDALGVRASAALDRRVLESLRELVPPGMDEIFAVAALAETEGRMIIDSAPTGHFLRLLELPELGLGWLHALMRLVLRYGRGEGLEAAGSQLLSAARRLKRLHATLRNEAGVVLVTLDEPLVRAETHRLSERLRKAGIPVVAWLVNRRRAVGEMRRSAFQVGVGVPILWAPEVEPPPRGAAALLEFFHRWRLT